MPTFADLNLLTDPALPCLTQPTAALCSFSPTMKPNFPAESDEVLLSKHAADGGYQSSGRCCHPHYTQGKARQGKGQTKGKRAQTRIGQFVPIHSNAFLTHRANHRARALFQFGSVHLLNLDLRCPVIRAKALPSPWSCPCGSCFYIKYVVCCAVPPHLHNGLRLGKHLCTYAVPASSAV